MSANKLRAVLEILRPELAIAAGVCVVLGEVVALAGFPSLKEAVFGLLCGFFISGSAIVLNDYFDLEVDRVNTPSRPLPAGRISPRQALALAAVTGLLGLAASFPLGNSAFLVCVLFWIVGVLYNWKFKAAGLLGNLMVSSSVGITFILGGMAVGQPWNKIVWCFALMAFFVDLGEEIAGDAMDVEGDRKRDSRSIAIQRGRSFALALSSVFFALVILISFIPVLFGWLGTTYLALIAITDVLIVVFLIRLLKSKTSQAGRGSMRGIYLGAMVGVLAAIVGQVIR